MKAENRENKCLHFKTCWLHIEPRPKPNASGKLCYWADFAASPVRQQMYLSGQGGMRAGAVSMIRRVRCGTCRLVPDRSQPCGTSYVGLKQGDFNIAQVEQGIDLFVDHGFALGDLTAEAVDFGLVAGDPVFPIRALG